MRATTDDAIPRCERLNVLLVHKPLHVLDIPDDYRYMDPELVDLLGLVR